MRITRLLFLIIAMSYTAQAADPNAPVSRMRELLSRYQSKELSSEFANEDFTTWPSSAQAKTIEALQLRARAYMVNKNGPRAEADLAPRADDAIDLLGKNLTPHDPLFARVMVLLFANLARSQTGSDPQDEALKAVPFNTKAGPEYQSAARLYQGVPGIARDDKSGRLWATWYSGGRGESKENYVVLVTSHDDGVTWTEPVLVIDPPHNVRTSDPCLWTSPDGRLWFFYCQNDATKQLHDGRWGVWYTLCEQPDRADSAWSAPRRICDGLMLNKPTVLRDGTWLLPVANWYNRAHGAGIVRSTDQGLSFTWIGGAPGRNAEWNGATTGGGMEHMIIERRDGTLWMPMRIKDGLAETTSHDGGVTWKAPVRSKLEGPGSRFHVRRLKSGRLLLINHLGFSRDVPILAQRSHLTAMLSDDEGLTWPHRLLLDDRAEVSYPDAVETPDGKLYIIYDRGRSSHREILLAITNEADILAGRPSDATTFRRLINKATGPR